GIRDDLVTGVQTCALPICSLCGALHRDATAIRRERRIELIVLIDPADGSDHRPGSVYPYKLALSSDCVPMSEDACGRNGKRTLPYSGIGGNRLRDRDGVAH